MLLFNHINYWFLWHSLHLWYLIICFFIYSNTRSFESFFNNGDTLRLIILTMKAIEVITLTELTPFITVKAVHLLRTAVNATGSHLSHRHVLFYLYNWRLGYSLYNWRLFFPTSSFKINLNVKTTTSQHWLLNLNDFLNYHRHLLLFNYLYYGFLWHILHNRLFHLRYLLIFYYLHHGLLWQSLHAWLLYLNFLVH